MIWQPWQLAYLRYSSEKSNPRSLIQQLHRALEKAHSNGHFIAWQYVFADAAVSGTHAFRRGYEMTKQFLQDQSHHVATLYIDEIGRLSRDMVEALMLGRMITGLGKRFIGVADGFDSNSEMSKLMLAIFGALQEWFIDQLRSKVNRGMDDAFDLGGNTGLPALGYRLVPLTDANGNKFFGKDGQPMKTLAIDDDASRFVLMAFELYGEKCWSKLVIARRFNELQVGGSKTWDGSGIHQLLVRHKYVGIATYRMTRHLIDPKTGKRKNVRPRREWKVRRARHWQIVPWALWKKVQRRLAERREAYKASRLRSPDAPTRADVDPKTLLRPRCGSCRHEFILGRSGVYPFLCCPNGIHGKHGCTCRGYKSVRIVEGCILEHVKAEIFTEERIRDLVKLANQKLIELAAEPKPEIGPIEAEIKRVEKRLNRWYKLFGKGENEMEGVQRRIRRCEGA